MSPKRQKKPSPKAPAKRVDASPSPSQRSGGADARQNIPRATLVGVLSVVATPLGNLSDLTPRAREVLAQATVILCEDTRRTSTLLAALGIGGVRLERFDAHVEAANASRFVDRLLTGESLVLVSDAGTPAVSDPGAQLVKLAGDAGVRVVPVPGVSSVIAAISVSGLVGSAGFCFRGFLPRKDGEKSEFFKKVISSPGECTVVFESPERLVSSLELIAEKFPMVRVCALKELTKVHERIFRGTAKAILEELAALKASDSQITSGEWVLVLQGGPLGEKDSIPNVEESSTGWEMALRCCLEAGVSASSAARTVSQNFATPKNPVYQRAISLAEMLHSSKKTPK